MAFNDDIVNKEALELKKIEEGERGLLGMLWGTGNNSRLNLVWCSFLVIALVTLCVVYVERNAEIIKITGPMIMTIVGYVIGKNDK